MTFRVLIPDSVDPSAVDLLHQHDDIEVTAPGNLNREQTIAALPGAQAMIIRSSTKANRELLEQAPDLRFIARAGVGVDNIDLDYATERGIIVMNTPKGNTIATAEHTFALMLSVARHVPEAYMSMREGRWDRKLYKGTELRGKTLGVVGLGRIGKAVAVRAQAFEMTVVAADPFVSADAMQELGIEKVELDDLYARVDYVTLHAVVTDETREMLNAAAFAKMKRGIRIVNAARGALINDEDLRDALESGIVAGVAMDVYQVEPPPAEHPLLDHVNVVHTPHLAASTVEAQIAVAVEAAELVIAALKHGEYDNIVNRGALEKIGG